MTDDITTIEIEVEGEMIRFGTSTGRRLVPVVVDGDEEDEQWLNLAQRAISNLRTHKGIKLRLDEEGDRLTLGDLLERNGLTVEDLEREHRLDEMDPVTDFSVGDVVEIERLHNGEPQDPERGVVRAVKPGDEYIKGRVEVEWGDGSWSQLEDHGDGVRCGRSNMMGVVHDIRQVDPDEAGDDLRDIRERVLDSAELDERAADLDVDVEATWTESGEVERATDQHARVTVSGGPFDEPVTVHCRNIFDFGWTASVEGDLEDDLEQLAIRAARNNSPISTNPRL